MEFFKDSDVPQYYKDITGLECDYCHTPYIVNQTRTVVKCGNPVCPRVLAGQIKNIIDMTNVKGYGKEKALGIIRSKGYRHIVDFLQEPPLDIEEEIRLLLSRTRRLDDAIKLLSIPEFGEIASRFFSKFNCMEEVLAVYDKEGTLEFEVISTFGDGKQMENIFEIINQHMDEFFHIDKLFGFDIKSVTSIKYDIDICVTGSVNCTFLREQGLSITTREKLIDLLNNQFHTRGYRFNLKANVTNNVSFVVCDDKNSTTTKAKQGAAKGILVTSDDMLASIVNHIKQNGEI